MNWIYNNFPFRNCWNLFAEYFKFFFWKNVAKIQQKMRAYIEQNELTDEQIFERDSKG